MLAKDLEIRDEAARFHAYLLHEVQQRINETKRTADYETLADCAFIAREVEEYLKAALVDVRAMGAMAQKIACVLKVKTNDMEPIRTAYCTASPDVKMAANLPSKRDPDDKYDRLLMAMGVPEEVVALADCPVQLHWPGLVEYLSKLAELGKPLPDGIDLEDTYSLYRLTIRKKEGGASVAGVVAAAQ